MPHAAYEFGEQVSPSLGIPEIDPDTFATDIPVIVKIACREHQRQANKSNEQKTETGYLLYPYSYIVANHILTFKTVRP